MGSLPAMLEPGYDDRHPAPVTAAWWRMERTLRNTVAAVFVREPVRGISVAVVILVVWLVIAGLVWGMLDFLGRPSYVALKPRLLEVLLGLFLFTLSVLVIASDTVLVWAALFRSRTALFHATLPWDDRRLFWVGAVDGGILAGWAVLMLVAPLVGVLATEAAQPVWFVPMAIAGLLAFIGCCLAAGALGALILARLIPLLRRGLRGLIALVVIAAVVVVVYGLGVLNSQGSPANFLTEIIGRLSFAENPWLPSWWASEVITGAMRGRWQQAWWNLGLLVGTAAALAVIGEAIAGRRLRRDLDAISGRPDHASGTKTRRWRVLPFLAPDTAILVAKDVRLFLRDPAQLFQVTAFVGMLTFYLLMLPRLGNSFRFDDFWKPVVSAFNLIAIGMALATFTGRFVFPLPSLEGRRLWVLALAPFPRRTIISAKFAFALVFGLPVGCTLAALSGFMLGLSPGMIAFQALVIACLATGLAASSLGLGAKHADYAADDAARLVAGFGGTLNLMASLILSALLLGAAAVPIAVPGIPWLGGLALVWVLTLTGLWTWWFLRLAWRQFDRAGDAG